MKKNSKIYIAGHTGMVGSAIWRKLEREGFANLVFRTPEELDLLDQKATESFFKQERPEYVFLAAAKVGGILANSVYPGQFIYENLEIQNHVIHQAYATGVRKLLFLGSSCIYPKLAHQPIREEYLLTGALEPTNAPYAMAKIAGITMCQAYRKQYGCSFIAVMPTNLYGPNDNYDLQNSHVLAALIRKLHLGACLERDDWEGLRRNLNQRPVDGVSGRNGEKAVRNILEKYGITQKQESSKGGKAAVKTTVTLWGTGSPFREFLFVDDLAAACLFLMKTYDDTEIINIGTGEDIAIRELAEIVRNVVGYQGKIAYDASKPDGTPRKQLDVSKLSNLGWKYSTSLKEGVEKTYRKYMDQRQQGNS